MKPWRHVLGLCLAMALSVSGCSRDTQEVTAPVSDVEPGTHQVTIHVTVPEDAPKVYLAGNLPALGPWHPARFPMTGSGSNRTATLSVPDGHQLQYKVTAGSWEQEGLGPSGTLLPNFSATITEDTTLTVDIAGFRTDPDELIEDWRGSDVVGELVYWKDMSSAFLDEDRHVVVWLPPGYDAESAQTYRVIYMHDGQNLFDPRLAYSNMDWGVDEAMMRGVENGEYEPAIIVGIWNTPERVFEYSPWHKAPDYARFLLEELMPKVAAEFQVKTGPEHTFSMGSSMGGLVSFYLVKEHPDVFGACGCVSSHLTWSAQAIEWLAGRDPSNADPMSYLLRDIRGGMNMPTGVRMYFDYGTEGLDQGYAPAHEVLANWLKTEGYEPGDALKLKQFDGAGHTESDWRARVGEQLTFMLAN
ncbi:MAG: alpha/beta hydrolase-fold protein [Woeseiaceae bacterium]